MTARSKSSGNDIEYCEKKGAWINTKTGKIDTNVEPCKHCGKKPKGVKLCKPKKHSGRDVVPVDNCIANLIQAFNDCGFETEGCCCGHGFIGYLQIKFNKKIKNVFVSKNGISMEFNSKKG